MWGLASQSVVELEDSEIKQIVGGSRGDMGTNRAGAPVDICSICVGVDAEPMPWVLPCKC